MPEGDNTDKIFKANPAIVSPGEIVSQMDREVAENLQKFRDPVVLATIMHMLAQERENTNRILKLLVQRIERLESLLESGTGAKTAAPEATTPMDRLLPEVDEAIVSFLREGPKSAEDVRKKLGYKGKNAACSRLNRLHHLGVVVKRQVGKKVFFSLP
jgi:hypothetical protein